MVKKRMIREHAIIWLCDLYAQPMIRWKDSYRLLREVLIKSYLTQSNEQIAKEINSILLKEANEDVIVEVVETEASKILYGVKK